MLCKGVRTKSEDLIIDWLLLTCSITESYWDIREPDGKNEKFTMVYFWFTFWFTLNVWTPWKFTSCPCIYPITVRMYDKFTELPNNTWGSPRHHDESRCNACVWALWRLYRWWWCGWLFWVVESLKRLILRGGYWWLWYPGLDIVSNGWFGSKNSLDGVLGGGLDGVFLCVEKRNVSFKRSFRRSICGKKSPVTPPGATKTGVFLVSSGV